MGSLYFSLKKMKMRNLCLQSILLRYNQEIQQTEKGMQPKSISMLFSVKIIHAIRTVQSLHV